MKEACPWCTGVDTGNGKICAEDVRRQYAKYLIAKFSKPYGEKPKTTK